MENARFGRAFTDTLANCNEETPSSQGEDAASHHLNSQRDFTKCFTWASPRARIPQAQPDSEAPHHNS